MPRTSSRRALASLAATVLAVGLGLWRGFSADNEGRAPLLAWATLPTLALALIALWRMRADLGRWLRPEWGDITRGFLAGLALFGAAYAFVNVALPATSPRAWWMARIYLMLGDPSRLRDHMILVAVGIVIASAAEEIVWRGLVVDLANELVGERRGWIAGGVLYAAAHLGTIAALGDEKAGPNPMLAVAALGCGLVWSFMRRSFGGRLPPSIVAHALFDWTVIMMFRLWGPSV